MALKGVCGPDSILESYRRGHVPGKPGLLRPRVRHCFAVPLSPEDFSLSGFMFQFYLDLTWDTVS